jgi:hypothetical protein
MRLAVLDALSARERTGLHGRAADVLARFMERGRDVEPAEVAEHLLRAGPEAAESAAAFAWRAADRAAGLLAFDDAVRWYDTATRVGGRSAAQRAALHVATGSARLGQGDRVAAREDFLHGADAAREAGDAELLARAALGLGAGPAGFEVDLLDREQIDLLEEARAALVERAVPEDGTTDADAGTDGDGVSGVGPTSAPADLPNAALAPADLPNADLAPADLPNADLPNADLPNADLALAVLGDADLPPADVPPAVRSLLALITARLSVATTMIEPPARRTALAEEAVALARAADDPGALAYALSALCDARSGPDDRTDRLRWSAEMIRHARRIHDLPLELLGRRLRLVALWEGGEVGEADAETLAYEAAANLLGQPLYLWYVPLWRGMRALLQGRHDDCLAALAEVEELGRQAASGNATMLALTQRWCLLVDLGDQDGIRDLLRESLPLDRLPGVWPQVSLALIAAQRGDLDRARRQLTAVAPRLAGTPRDSEWLPMLAQVAETVALAGPHPVAGPVHALLEPYADLFAVEGIGAVLRGPVHRFLAPLAAALGDEAAAARHLARTRELAAEVGAPTWAGPLAGQPHADAVPDAPANAFRHEGQWWTLHYLGREARIRDSKGLRDLAVLLSRPGTPVPALDLAAAAALPAPSATTASGHGIPAAGTTAAGTTDSADAVAFDAGLHEPGDLGELVDAPARAAYRRRLEHLRVEADDADALGDRERSARIALEREALVEQLSAAYGLGGRPRRAGSPAERARSTVTARIRAAVDRIAGEHPELGRHLRASVHTGTLCVYEPETDPHWSL